MTLLMRDRENQKIGKEIGKIFGAISMGKDLGLSEEEIISRLQAKFDLTEERQKHILMRPNNFYLRFTGRAYHCSACF